MDWAIGDEWTSGSDFFKDPWALRVAPHPNKVSVPVMAISHDGDAIGLAWDPNAVAAVGSTIGHSIRSRFSPRLILSIG